MVMNASTTGLPPCRPMRFFYKYIATHHFSNMEDWFRYPYWIKIAKLENNTSFTIKICFTRYSRKGGPFGKNKSSNHHHKCCREENNHGQIQEMRLTSGVQVGRPHTKTKSVWRKECQRLETYCQLGKVIYGQGRNKKSSLHIRDYTWRTKPKDMECPQA